MSEVDDKLAKKKRKAERMLAKQDEAIAAQRASDKEKSKIPYTYVPGSGMIDFTEVSAHQKAFFDAEDAAIAAAEKNDAGFADMVAKMQTDVKTTKKLSSKVKAAMAPLDRESDLFARQVAAIKANAEPDDEEPAAKKQKVKGAGGVKPPSGKTLEQRVAASGATLPSAPAKVKKPRARATISRSIATQVVAFEEKLAKFFPQLHVVPAMPSAAVWAKFLAFWNDSKFLIAIASGRRQPNFRPADNVVDNTRILHRAYVAIMNFREHMLELRLRQTKPAAKKEEEEEEEEEAA